jgi:predicted nicotinamide N-methyase
MVTPCRVDLAASPAALPPPGNCPVNAPKAQPTSSTAALGTPEVVLAADVFYQRELAAIALRFLLAARQAGAHVLIADPGRAFVPKESLTALRSYQVPVLPVLEDASVKQVTIYTLR